MKHAYTDHKPACTITVCVHGFASQIQLSLLRRESLNSVAYSFKALSKYEAAAMEFFVSHTSEYVQEGVQRCRDAGR